MYKIALVAPFEELVPPKTYGGTERIVYALAEELVKHGHNVTLLASKGSHTPAKLVACVNKPIRTLPESHIAGVRQGLNYQGLGHAIDYLNKNKFDIVHNHFGWQLLLFKNLIKAPIVTTLHGTLSEPTEKYMHNALKNERFISISNSQRRHGAKLRYVATVYNGIDTSRYKFNNKPDDYLVFLGRIHPHKGPEYAIEIAKKSGRRLIIAAKIDPYERHYYEDEVRPLIDNKRIKFIGEVNHSQKVKLLKKAYAMIAPIQWDEPFGLTTIESLACGTPVVAIKRGSMREIIKDGKTGYLCSNMDEMIDCIEEIDKIDRSACRIDAEQRFTAARMAEDYLKVYKKVINQNRRSQHSANVIR